MDDSEKQSVIDAPLLEFSHRASAVRFQQAGGLFDTARARQELLDHLEMRGESDGPARVRGLSAVLYARDLAGTATSVDPAATHLNHVTVGEHECKDEDLVAELEAGLNRQLRWLLVTAFESHERFIKNLYAAVGYIDPSLWRGKDIGDETLGGANGKPLEWYQERIRKSTSRSGCKELLAHLRKVMPQIVEYESTPWITLPTDHRFWLATIEAFRHVIVHSNGEFSEDAVWKVIAESTGLSLTGNDAGIAAKKSAVRGFCLLAAGGQLSIQLLQPDKLSNKPNDGSIWRFRQLFEIVVNYDYMVYSVVCRHFGIDRVWERGTSP